MKTHSHETTISALFESMGDARHALEELESFHLDPRDLRLINSHEAYEQEQYKDLMNLHVDKMHEESLHNGKIGGVAGAFLAAATALTGMLTGGASILAAAPIIILASGAGGLLGGLIGAGFTENEATSTDQAIQSGKILLVVHTDSSRLSKDIEEVLKHEHGEHVHHYFH